MEDVNFDNLVSENGYLVDYDNVYDAKLSTDNKTVVGYRTYFEYSRAFSGLLDIRGHAVWNINKNTLRFRCKFSEYE